jgi:putative ABC transport system permease protein
VDTIPGIDSTGITSHLPLSGRRLNVDVAVEGRPLPPAGQPLLADCSSVSVDFFRVMNIPLRRGRAFTARDADGSAPSVVINDEMARRLWPDADPIGRHLIVGTTSGADQRPREIVGVVSNVRAGSLETAPGFQLYVPFAQNPWPTMSLVVRTSGEPTSRAGEIRAALLALDPDQPVYNVRSLEEVTSRAVALRRFQMFVLVLFAVVGLALAAIGIYSVVVYAVRLRTREIGLRLALGAPRRDVVLLVIRSGIAWAGAGIAAGGALALAAGGLLRGMLFGVAPTDALTFVGVVSFVTIVLMVGSGVAGRRAASVDPLIALRQN